MFVCMMMMMILGLAIRANELAAWKKSPYCRPAPDDCLICPLCMSTVEDTDEAWKQHLVEGCPKHNRNR